MAVGGSRPNGSDVTLGRWSCVVYKSRLSMGSQEAAPSIISALLPVSRSALTSVSDWSVRWAFWRSPGLSSCYFCLGYFIITIETLTKTMGFRCPGTGIKTAVSHHVGIRNLTWVLFKRKCANTQTYCIDYYNFFLIAGCGIPGVLGVREF